MASTAARSILRSSSLRSAAARVASRTSAGPSFRLPTAPRILRSPVELSFCVESLMPLHSATASSLMTSMLSVSCRSRGWLSEAGSDGV